VELGLKLLVGSSPTGMCRSNDRLSVSATLVYVALLMNLLHMSFFIAALEWIFIKASVMVRLLRMFDVVLELVQKRAQGPLPHGRGSQDGDDIAKFNANRDRKEADFTGVSTNS
jgi:hypothetical protein